MRTVVEGIAVFTKTFDGELCPECRKSSMYLSTTNEWKYYCNNCDIRFNDKGLIYKAPEE